jgi:hypothetical protein
MEEHVDAEVDERQLEEMDRKAVEDEIQKYEHEAIVDASSQKDFDLMRYWQVRVQHLICMGTCSICLY